MNFDIMFKDTLNRRVCVVMATKNEEILRKPDWLKIKLNTNKNYTGLKKMMREKILILYVKKLNVLIYMNVGVHVVQRHL